MAGGLLTRRVLTGLALAGLVACEQVPVVETPPSPPARPEQPETPPPPTPEVTEPSEGSMALRAYYQRLQNDLIAGGLMRGDGGTDIPLSASTLSRNFIRIALFDEYVVDGDEIRAEATVSRLRRWEEPIRMSVEFGSSVPLAQRDRDAASVGTFANRLQRLTGVPITQTNSRANFHVLILNEGDRLGYQDRLQELLPGAAPATLRALMFPPRQTLCLAVAFADETGARYTKAVILIRGEHPDLLRLACIHEELAQAMGLANDSTEVRPSIFNDDEEFGLLTRHDEILLQMLYDDRLTPGMSAAEAAPIARIIASELMGGPV